MNDAPLDVLFTAPHPDDLEIGMGGAIAKLVRQGYRVGMLHMTSGEPTPRGSVEVRAAEAAAGPLSWYSKAGEQSCPRREEQKIAERRPRTVMSCRHQSKCGHR